MLQALSSLITESITKEADVLFFPEKGPGTIVAYATVEISKPLKILFMFDIMI
jgi:hypothetical protein